jgi:hypothetical protein
MAIFFCLKLETFSTWRARSPYLYPPGTGWPGYTARHWVPFSSPPTTRKATVAVLDPAFTQDSNSSCLTSSLYSLGAAPTENTASSLLLHVKSLQPQGCVATSAALTTEDSDLLLLRTLVSAGICLPNRCPTMNFQASC